MTVLYISEEEFKNLEYGFQQCAAGEEGERGFAG